MITQGRGQPIYLLSNDPEVRVWHCRFAYASNGWIIQAFKLVDRIKLSDVATSNYNDDQFSSDSEADDGKQSEPNIDIYINPTLVLLHKDMGSIKNLCDTCIKNKYIKIIKHKAMTSAVQKLKEIHANLWGPHNLPFILEKSYISLLLDKYIQKSWVLFLRRKDVFFDTFK